MTQIKIVGVIVSILAILFSITGIALAATAPSLGTAESFAVLGGSTVTNTGPTIVNGDLGVSPGSSVTGFPPGILNGNLHLADATSLQAQNDVTTAYNDLLSQACDFGSFGPTDLAGQTLVPGVYCYSSSVSNSGTLTLNAQGNDNSVWVFKTGSTLITSPGSSINFINNGNPCNVFWQVGSSATIDTTTIFLGNILAADDITVNNGANVFGRLLARGVSADGGITLDSNFIDSSCDAQQIPEFGWGTAVIAIVGSLLVFTVIRNRRK